MSRYGLMLTAFSSLRNRGSVIAENSAQTKRDLLERRFARLGGRGSRRTAAGPEAIGVERNIMAHHPDTTQRLGRPTIHDHDQRAGIPGGKTEALAMRHGIGFAAMHETRMDQLAIGIADFNPTVLVSAQDHASAFARGAYRRRSRVRALVGRSRNSCRLYRVERIGRRARRLRW